MGGTSATLMLQMLLPRSRTGPIAASVQRAWRSAPENPEWKNAEAFPEGKARGCTHFMDSRSRMTIDPRFPTLEEAGGGGLIASRRCWREGGGGLPQKSPNKKMKRKPEAVLGGWGVAGMNTIRNTMGR